MVVRVETAIAAVAQQRLLVMPFAGDVDEATVADAEAARHGGAEAVAAGAAGGAAIERQFTAVRIFLQDDVNHPGDGVGAILGGGAVAQHFHAADGGHGNGAQIRAAGAPTDHAVQYPKPGHAVAPLAVDEH